MRELHGEPNVDAPAFKSSLNDGCFMFRTCQSKGRTRFQTRPLGLCLRDPAVVLTAHFLLQVILKLLSEEVFDFSRGELTQAKTKELKSSLNADFRMIHDLCLYVLNVAARPELIRCASPPWSTEHIGMRCLPSQVLPTFGTVSAVRHFRYVETYASTIEHPSGDLLLCAQGNPGGAASVLVVDPLGIHFRVTARGGPSEALPAASLPQRCAAVLD